MTTTRFNLVMLCLDTFRWDLFEHEAPWPVDLPNLDALRSESVEFVQAFGEAQPTIPIRRAYFTGQRSFPWRYDFDTEGLWPTGRGWHKIPPEQATMAEVLLDHGYRTGLVSDTYHMFKPTMNFTRGFTSYEFVRGYESDNFRGGVLAPSDLRPFTRNPDPASNPVLGQYLLNVRGREREEDWLSARVFDTAAHWVEDHRGAEPFMLWVDSFGPHEPWDPPRSFVDRFYGDYEGIEFIYPIGMRAEEMTMAESERVRHLYLGYLSFVDACVGRLLGALEREGLWDHTIVAVVNDHGTELLDHGRFTKHQSHLFAHNTQLIWTVRHPEVGSRYEHAGLVQSHDLFPTMLGLLGVDHPEVAGRDVWPASVGTRTARHASSEDPAPAEWVVGGWGNYASVRSAAWNYVVDFEDPSGDEHLYNLVDDPAELVDVAGEEPGVVEQCRGRLEGFLGEALPTKLSDQVHPSVAPIRRFLGSSVPQRTADAGFV